MLQAPRVLPEAQVQRLQVRLASLDLQARRARVRQDQLDKERRVLRGLLAAVRPAQPDPQEQTELRASQVRQDILDRRDRQALLELLRTSRGQPALGGLLGQPERQDQLALRRLSPALQEFLDQLDLLALKELQARLE